MSADPTAVLGRKPGWFVVTDQGVILSARFDHQPYALTAHAAVVAGLRRELARDGRPGRFIAERVRAVQVRYGLEVGAWNGFQPLPRP